MKNNIVNARELFLLCALRSGKTVFAKNLDIYDWTFRHYAFVLEKVSEMKSGESYSQTVRNAKDEARLKIPVQKPQERNFYIREGEISHTLCDLDEDLSWYDPRDMRLDLKDWVYGGNFILSDPMSQREQFIIENYGKFNS